VIAFSRRATGRPASLIVHNNAECRIEFSLKGPSPAQRGIDAARSEPISVSEGNYEYGVDTRHCSGDVRNLYSPGLLFVPGGRYDVSISQQDITRGGNLVIANTTNADLQVEVRNIRRTIGAGSRETIQLPAGPYSVVMKGRCGNTLLRGTMRVEMEKDLVVGRSISCTTVTTYTSE
jgi:hypothetical protein